MAYKPVNRNKKTLKEVLADPKTRAIYEATKLQIDHTIKLKNSASSRQKRTGC